MMEENEKEPNKEEKAGELAPPEESKEAKELTPPKQIVEKGFNFGNLFLGIFIVLIGLVFLGRSTGLFDIDIDIWQLWPLLVIAFGLSLMSRGRAFAGIITAMITLLVLAVVGLMIFFGPISDSSRLSGYSEDFSIDREAGVGSALIGIKTGAGKLKIEGGANELVLGRFESNLFRLDTKSKVKNGVQEVLFSTKGSWKAFGGRTNDLELSINPTIPLRLEVDTGATDMDFDLSEVNAKYIDIDTGASSLDMVMGDQADLSIVKIDSGASSIDITLPSTVGARLRLDAGLSSKNLQDFKKIDSKTYESRNYDETGKKVRIDLKVGVSSVNINWD